jgi:outer membrane lipoprotein-sorting protein
MLALVLALAAASPVPTPSPPAAPSPAVDSFLARLAAAGRKVQSLSGEFVQRKRVAAFKQELTSHGRFECMRAGHLEWRYTDPDPSALVVDGDHATLTLPDEPPRRVELAQRPGLRAILAQLQLLLGGAVDLERARGEYEMTLMAGKGSATLHLVPRAESLRTRVRAIDVEFDDRTLLPRSARLLEASGDVTQIAFSRLVRR